MTQPTRTDPLFQSALDSKVGPEALAADSNQEISHSDAADQASLIDRVSSTANSSIGQSIALTASPLAVECSPSSPPIAPNRLSKIFNLGRESRPLNIVLSYLNTSDIFAFKASSRQSTGEIQREAIPLIFKQQLEFTKRVNQSDLNKYQKLSGENLSSNKIESLYLEENWHPLFDADEVIFDLTSDDFYSIPTRFKNLKHIYLANSPLLTDSSLVPFICSYPNLQSLTIENLAITDEALTQIAQTCSQLKSLTLIKCGQTDDTDIIDRGSIHRGISDRGIIAAVQNCRDLQHLSLQGFTQYLPDLFTPDSEKFTPLTDRVFIEIANECKSLIYLDLEDIRGFTDQTLIHLSRGCPNLKYINIRYSDPTEYFQITDSGLMELVQNMPQLRQIELIGCRKINPATIQKINATHPNLQVSFIPRRKRGVIYEKRKFLIGSETD